MSVSLPQEIFRKTNTDSQKTLEPSLSGDIPDGSFKELLQPLPIDEKPRNKDLFSLMEEEEEEKIIEGFACAQISLSSPFLEQKKEQMGKVDAAICSPPPVFPHFIPDNPSNSATPVHSALFLEIEALFEKMASSMIVMSSSGEIETTLCLDNPSSIFFGTKITIREFSTAPKTFNVEIASFTPAILAIEASKSDLLSAFQNGKFNFSIHRFETSCIQNEDRPVLHRKESSDRDNKERKGGREE